MCVRVHECVYIHINTLTPNQVMRIFNQKHLLNMSSRQRSSTHTKKQTPHYVGEWTDLINEYGTYEGMDFTNVDHMTRNISRGENIPDEN